MESYQRWGYRCHQKVLVDRNQTKSKLDCNWEEYHNKSFVDLTMNDMLKWTCVKPFLEMYQKGSV